MEKDQRNALRNAVVKARQILEKEVQDQLEGIYNILPDGVIADDAPGDPIVRARLLDLIEHHRARGASAAEAVERTKREAAFTVLNRFAALKMAERRGLVRQCISEGMHELAESAPGLRAALEDGGYRLLLEAVMDELSLDLKVLFDRRDSIAQLWPSPIVLAELLQTLNDPQLVEVWSEDEAIGWSYQYFNADDAKKMREAVKGGAPRNSRELAVRNQFFTPRYVVEFLTDNTLGRTWYEMNRGETRLGAQCRYLVGWPDEVFLHLDEVAPEQRHQDSLSKEELLQQPKYIPHRPLKDPREIGVLDPACGSMHFGLYSFDLLEVIYEEAWELAHADDESLNLSEAFAPFRSFVRLYADKAAFLVDVPRLIIEHNLHGIDIDARAAQIAGLSLWLRAQRAWQHQGLLPQERPRIRRANIVCAEPMPGEEMFLDEFIEAQLSVTPEHQLLGQLVRRVFDAMGLADEAGSLLKAEERVAKAVREAKQQWVAVSKTKQGILFADEATASGQGEPSFDVAGITDEAFWGRAEERIYAALAAYSMEAASRGGLQRGLFADDVARGFAFIDISRKRYDVVLMNPPFGMAPSAIAPLMATGYPACKEDIDAAFVRRGVELLEAGGRLGAIVNRTQLTKTTLEDWRRCTLLGEFALQECADLGLGVLDDALVETAAYCLGRAATVSQFFRLGRSRDRAKDLVSSIRRDGNGSESLIYVATTSELASMPAARIAYWVPASLRRALAELPRFEGMYGTVRQGTITSDNFRFLRLLWEVPKGSIAHSVADTCCQKPWVPYAKGGDYSPYYQDLHLAAR